MPSQTHIIPMDFGGAVLFGRDVEERQRRIVVWRGHRAAPSNRVAAFGGVWRQWSLGSSTSMWYVSDMAPPRPVQQCLGASGDGGTLGTNNSTTNLTAGGKQKAVSMNDRWWSQIATNRSCRWRLATIYRLGVAHFSMLQALKVLIFSYSLFCVLILIPP